jgi:cytochrome b
VPPPVAPTKVRVWDLPTRVFHWLLLGLIVFSVVSAKIGGNMTIWHMRAGYAVLALLLFRILWGLVGSQSARFASFVKSPFAVFRYLAASFANKAAPIAGHNAAGGYSVLLLLTALLTQAVTGLFIDDEIANQGPLYQKVPASVVSWATRIHHWNENVIYVAVGLHIVAILVYTFVKREPLVKAMVTGEKEWPAAYAKPDLAFRPLWLAVVLICATSAFVYWLVTIFPK